MTQSSDVSATGTPDTTPGRDDGTGASTVGKRPWHAPELTTLDLDKTNGKFTVPTEATGVGPS